MRLLPPPYLIIYYIASFLHESSLNVMMNISYKFILFISCFLELLISVSPAKIVGFTNKIVNNALMNLSVIFISCNSPSYSLDAIDGAIRASSVTYSNNAKNFQRMSAGIFPV